MSTGSQGDSDEDESEPSSLISAATLITKEGTVSHNTLIAVYHKWAIQTAVEHPGSSESSTIFQYLSKECTENLQQNGANHIANISDLPYEILLNIFRWAVGIHLDTTILGKLAQVCRGFYILSCDPCLWRSVCFRQWPGLGTEESESTQPNHIPQLFGYVSWKDMAIRRPHVLLGGCYLCRITYVRAGESQFTDCCRQFHLVVYYRGIRFYPDGRVCMLTSTDAPNAIVAALGKFRNSDHSAGVASATVVNPDSSSVAAADSGLLNGTYEWCDPNFVVCTLSRTRHKDKGQPLRQRLRRNLEPELQVSYHIRFRLASSKRRLHSILHWDSYVIHTRNTSTQNNHSTSLDVSTDQFPSCHFSPVRSYTSEVAPHPI